MHDYTLPLMLAREQLRRAEAAVEEGRLVEVAEAIVTARAELTGALRATYAEMAEKQQARQ